MKTILVILVLAAIGVGTIIYFIKKGKIKDRDGDYIPDVVEDTAEDIEDFVEDKIKDGKELLKDAEALAKEVKSRAKNAKDELEDVLEELADVSSALQGKVTKTKLRKFTKKDLLALASKDFDTEYPTSITKTNLVNKVYSLYNNK